MQKTLPMSEPIDFSKMPNAFRMCNVADCKQAETCLRRLAYEAYTSEKPFINMLNPKCMAVQKGKCPYYLNCEPVRRARGFIRTVNAISSGKLNSFRLSAMARMGYRRYYRARKGEVLLTKAEEDLIVNLANRYGLQMESYFDTYEQVLLWTNE